VLDWVARQNEAGLGQVSDKCSQVLTTKPHVAKLVEQLANRISAANGILTTLTKELSLDYKVAFGVEDSNQATIPDLIDRCSRWLETPEELSRWNNYFIRMRTARNQGMSGLIALLEMGSIPTKSAPHAFDRVYFSQLFVRWCAKTGTGSIDGTLHEKHVTEFKQLDQERLALAKYRTLVAHYERMPQVNAGIGAAGIVKSEMEENGATEQCGNY